MKSRCLALLVAAALLVPAAAFAKDEKPSGEPVRAVRVAILPFVNASAELSATKMMEDVMRDEMKRVDKSRAIFLMPADVERLLADSNNLDKVYRITDKYGRNTTLDSTAVAGIDALLQVDAVLCVKINEWENHRVPVIGAGQSSATVGLAFTLFDIRSMDRTWHKTPREQRFSAEMDASSSHLNYDETGVIQRKSDNSPPRYEVVAADLVRDAFKNFPVK